MANGAVNHDEQPAEEHAENESTDQPDEDARESFLDEEETEKRADQGEGEAREPLIEVVAPAQIWPADRVGDEVKRLFIRQRALAVVATVGATIFHGLTLPARRGLRSMFCRT